MVGTLNLHKTWQHGRSLLAGFGATILATVSVGCAASTGNTSPENKTPPESTSIATAQNSLDGVADKTLNQSQQSVAVEAKSIAQSESSSEFDPESFTTEGKPTKTIETPWGPREVYDPAQDEEILKAIEDIYQRGDVFFGDVHRVPLDRPVKADKLKSVRLIRHARIIQSLDMSRAGCRIIYSVPCQAWTTTVFTASCPVPNFGHPDLSDCEKRNKIHRGVFGGVVTVPPIVDSGFDRRAYPADAYYTCRVGGIDGRIQTYNKVGVESGYNLEQTKTLLTVSECGKWSTDIDFSYDKGEGK